MEEGSKKSEWGVSWTTSELSVSTPTSGRLQPRMRAVVQDGGTRGRTFHGEMDRCRKSRAGTRHTVVCSNVTGRTTERMVQSNRARVCSLAIADSSQVARTCILQAFLGLHILCCLTLAFSLFCYVSFSYFCFKLSCNRSSPVLSTCPLHTNSGCGKEAHIDWSMVTCQDSTRSELP